MRFQEDEGRLATSFALSLLLHSWVLLWVWSSPLAVEAVDRSRAPLRARLLPASVPANDRTDVRLAASAVAEPQGGRVSRPARIARSAIGSDPGHEALQTAVEKPSKPMTTFPDDSRPTAATEVATTDDRLRSTSGHPTTPTKEGSKDSTTTLPVSPSIATAPAHFETNDADPESASGPATPPAVAKSGAEIDGDSVRAYRLALAREAGRFRHYPAQARAAGWYGRVTLSLSLAVPPTLSIAKSSGRKVLDEAALVMMQQAVARVPPPATLRERAASLDLTIEFDLTEP